MDKTDMNKLGFSNNILTHISVDCILFGFYKKELHVLLLEFNKNTFEGLIKENTPPHVAAFFKKHIKNFEKNKLHRGLIGGHVSIDKSLDESAMNAIHQFIDAKDRNIYLRQLGAFGDVNRVEFERVITVAYYSLLNPDNYELKDLPIVNSLKWHKLSELPDDISFDHKKLIQKALIQLREDVRLRPVGFNLLPEKFTLTELQNLYECLLGNLIDTRNFRKKIQKMNLLVDTGEMQTGVSHRAAKLYRFDINVYNKLINNGFEFRI